MCTAITYKTQDFYFGRTLDYEMSFGEEVVITPRAYPFSFRHLPMLRHHYAIIGMAYVAENYPLYYDAVNEKGLAVAGLNFVGNAYYGAVAEGKDNLAQFELIPWLLGQCASVKEVKVQLERMHLVNTPFNATLPLAQLHWLIADRFESITVEAVKEGIKVYDNPVGVLTNNPPFELQSFRLNDYMGLSAHDPVNTFSDKVALHKYSRGMGALGLPGDLSSSSRFVRASFVKLHSISGRGEEESVNQFFHILSSVEQPRGCCAVGEEDYEKTVYTCCCNADRGIYYYTVYENHQISAVDMHKIELDGAALVRYPLLLREEIRYQNV